MSRATHRLSIFCVLLHCLMPLAACNDTPLPLVGDGASDALRDDVRVGQDAGGDTTRVDAGGDLLADAASDVGGGDAANDADAAGDAVSSDGADLQVDALPADQGIDAQIPCTAPNEISTRQLVANHQVAEMTDRGLTVAPGGAIRGTYTWQEGPTLTSHFVAWKNTVGWQVCAGPGSSKATGPAIAVNQNGGFFLTYSQDASPNRQVFVARIVGCGVSQEHLLGEGDGDTSIAIVPGTNTAWIAFREGDDVFGVEGIALGSPPANPTVVGFDNVFDPAGMGTSIAISPSGTPMFAHASASEVYLRYRTGGSWWNMTFLGEAPSVAFAGEIGYLARVGSNSLILSRLDPATHSINHSLFSVGSSVFTSLVIDDLDQANAVVSSNSQLDLILGRHDGTAWQCTLKTPLYQGSLPITYVAAAYSPLDRKVHVLFAEGNALYYLWYR